MVNMFIITILFSSELNLGVDPSEFTVIHRYSPATHGELSLWVG